MITEKQKKLKIYLSIFSLFVLLLNIFGGEALKIPYNPIIIGISSYCLFMEVGKILEKNATICFFCNKISRYSYVIFLTHHIIADKLRIQFNGFPTSRFEHLCIFIIYIVMIFFSSKFIFLMIDYLKKFIQEIPCFTEKRIHVFYFLFTGFIILFISYNFIEPLIKSKIQYSKKQPLTIFLGFSTNLTDNNFFCLDTPLEQIYQNLSTKKDLTLDGWAADSINKDKLNSLYVVIDDFALKPSYGIARPDVAKALGLKNENLGWHIVIPNKYIKNNIQLNFYFIEKGGKFMYLPKQIDGIKKYPQEP